MSSTKEIQLDHNQIPTTDKNPKHKINVVLDQSLSKTRQSEINGGSSRYPRALTKQAKQLILHVVYLFIQIGRRSTTDHWGLASHQS